MFEDLAPFVSSAYCLQCRGCCIFRDAESVWSPRVTNAEAAEFARLPQCGTNAPSVSNRLKTLPAGEDHQCFFLNRPDHHCAIYSQRPFECRLYPFLLSSESDGVRLHAHLGCPFVQENVDTKEWTGYLAILRAFFSRADVRRFVAENRDIFADYSSLSDEIRPIFDVRRTFPEQLLRERDRFDRHAARGANALSARAFANLFVWQDMFDFDLEDIDGALCVFARQPVGSFLYLPPLGDAVSSETFSKVFTRLRSDNRGGSLGRIENVSQSEFAAFDPARDVITERGPEYIYAREDIVGLHGNALKSKRHDVNLVERVAWPQYRPYAPSDREGCERLFERWLGKKRSAPEEDGDGLGRQMLGDAAGAHACLWGFSQQLGLEGRVVEVDGRVAAYTFGCRLNDETFCVLAEVADPAVVGLAAFIFHAFAADEALRSYRWINAMGHDGLPSIARTKMSWRPAALEAVYSVTRKEESR
jgi:Fe-S-cluster containining protein